MRITQVTAYQFDAPVVEAEGARISGGRQFSDYTTTMVRIDTDEGTVGWGESAPYGPNYLPYIAGAILPGLEIVVPKLLGQSPLTIQQINETMDLALYGHPHVKTGIDMACWDILGKRTRLPLYELLGGKLVADPEVQAFVLRTPGEALLEMIDRHRANGVHHFTSKVSGDLENWTPMSSFWLFDDCDGYRNSIELIDEVDGVPSRFYQVERVDPDGP